MRSAWRVAREIRRFAVSASARRSSASRSSGRATLFDAPDGELPHRDLTLATKSQEDCDRANASARHVAQLVPRSRASRSRRAPRRAARFEPRPPSPRRGRPISPISSTASPTRWSTSPRPRRSRTRPRRTIPDLPKGTPFDDMFEQFFKNHGFNNGVPRAAQDVVARLRLRHRPERHRHHQQSRGRRRQRHRRHLHRRAQAEGEDRRQGPQGRRRGAEGRERQAAQDGEVRRQRQGAGRRRRDGGRQSVRPRRDGDGRHHFGAQPQHRQRPLRRLPADRRLDQQGQFGRPAVQPAGRGHRHQHRDPFALRRFDRHRLRHALRRASCR